MELIIIICIIWLVSPIALIILAVWLNGKNKRYNRFLLQLLQEGRITRQEYNELFSQNAKRSFYVPPQQLPPQQAPLQNPQMVRPTYTVRPSPQPINNYQPYQQPKPQRSRRETNSLLLLILGTALIVLSGIVFSTAMWTQLTNLARVGILALAGIFFLAVSFVAGKRLNLESTGMAFYLLGAAFASIAFVTMGYFELMGEWYSLDGDGVWLLLGTAFAIIVLFSVVGTHLYHKQVFVHISLYGIMVTVMLICLQMFDGADAWGFAMNIISGGILLLDYLNFKQKPANLYDRAFDPFAKITAAFFILCTLPNLVITIDNWSIASLFTMLIWDAQLIFYSNKFKSKAWMIINAAAFNFTLYAVANILISEVFSQIDKPYLSGFVFVAAQLIFIILPKKTNMRTPLTDISFIGMTACFAINWIGLNKQTSICSTVYMAFIVAFVLCLVVERKPKYRMLTLFWRHVFPVTLITLSGYFVTFLQYTDIDDVSGLRIFMLLTMLFTICFMLIHKIRTPFSDALFPIVLTFLGFSLNSVKDPIVAIVCWFCVTALLVCLAFEKNPSPVHAAANVLSPLPMVFVFLRLGGLVDNAGVGMLIGSIILTFLTAVISFYSENSDSSMLKIAQYPWVVAAAILLLFASFFCEGVALMGTCLLICAALFVVTIFEDVNLTAILPVATFYVISFRICKLLPTNTLEQSDIYIITSAAIMAVLILASRLIFNKKLCYFNNKSVIRLDVAQIGAFFSPFFTVINGGGEISVKTALFIAIIEACAVWINMIRYENPRRLNLSFMSIAAFAACSLVAAQPFVIISSGSVMLKLCVASIELYAIAMFIIWRGSPEKAYSLGFGISLAGFLLLVYDALYFQSVANTIFVCSVAITLIVWSIRVKSFRWFIISAATLLGLSLYITKDSLESVAWWVYLLVAGILLIAIAAANEYSKTHGGGKQLGRRFLQWWKK